ncbi:hypothetical protein BKI52_15280 [marine bacterium AO1-C]|nr:hypothetical protein BKI52_15280 [marine bacterium AO1-C]
MKQFHYFLQQAILLSILLFWGASNLQAQDIHREGDQEERLRFEQRMLVNPQTGTIPNNIREKELMFVLSNPSLTKSTKNKLRTTGTESTTWNRRGPFNVGGRTRALAIDRTNESIILAGGVSGGMWRSTDGGASWTQTTGASQIHSVTDVYQDPNNTNVWYYVTGEVRGNSASGGGAPFRGDGVFKSTDGGVTWVSLASTTADPTVFSGSFQYSSRVRVDPTNSDVYIAAYDGIYRSTNGTDFSKVLDGATAQYTDLEISATGVIYATIASNSTASKGVFKSTDGTNWNDITPALATGYQRINIDVAPSNENIIYVFANTPNAGTNDHQVFYSNDAGTSWTDRTSNLPAFGGSVGNLSQGSYNQFIKIRPDNPNIVFIGSTNLYRTTNGFATTTTNAWIGGYSPANNVSRYENHHPDNHALVFYPSNPAKMLSGHDGGVSRTNNNLANTVGTFPVTWEDLNKGYYTTQVYGLAIDPVTSGDQRLMAGFQDNGKWTATTTSGTAAWGEEPAGGDGCYVAIVAGEDTRYTSTQRGKILRFKGSVIGTYTDADGIQPAAATGQLFVNPFILDKSDQNIMYYPSGSVMWRNTNLAGINSGYTFNGTSTGWTSLTGTSTGGSSITALDVSKSNAAHVLYYGTSDGKIFRLDNAHTSTASATDIYTGKGLPANAYVSSIAVDPSNSLNVIVVFSNYGVQSLFYSTDAGANWTHIGGNLEENPDGSGNGPSVRWAEIHRDKNGNPVYLIGTSTGLYATQNLNGNTTVWNQEGPNTIGNVPVMMIQGRSSDNLVAIGTHGVGLFSATVEGAAPICNSPTSLTASNITVSTATLNWGATAGVNSYDVRYTVRGSASWVEVNGLTNATTNITGLTSGTTYEFQVRINCAAGTGNYSTSGSFTTTEACVMAFPYNESFESGLGKWKQSSSDGIDWNMNSGSTPSSNTGPSQAADGTSYLYTEATNNFSETAILTSPCFDLTSLTNPSITFNYHMYGSNMGTLTLEASKDNGATWSSLWTKSGDQGDNWFIQSVIMTNVKGSNVLLRFVGKTGTSFRSDMAIDNITIDEGKALSISDFNPKTASEGTEVTITGEGFSTTTANNKVNFNGTLATITSATATELKVTVPTGATTGKISVEVNGQLVNSTEDFVVIQLPTITSFAPQTGSIGTEVTITGSNFDGNSNNNTVKFNGTLATITSATTTELIVTVPEGATTGKITVEVQGNVGTSTQDFTVVSSVTGLPNDPKNGLLTLFPNPVKDVLQLKLEGKVANKVEVTIYNMLGNQVLHSNQKLQNGEMNLNLEHLPSGQYILKIKTGEEILSRKILKK